MKRQFKIFAVVFLSMAAGMASSELLSKTFDPSSTDSTQAQAQPVTSAEVAGLPVHLDAVN